jgi:Protein of unknown function (DUF3309)
VSVLGLILVIFLVVILLGGVGGPYVRAPWTYGYGYGHSGIGLLGVLLIILIILMLSGRMPY